MAVSEHEVAHRVDDGSAPVDLDAAGHVGVMAEDDIGAGVDDLVGESAHAGVDILVVLDPPMEADRDEVGQLSRVGDVFADEQRIERDDTRLRLRGEGRAAVVHELRVAEEGDPDPLTLEDGRTPRVRQVAARAHVPHSDPAEVVDGVEKPLALGVERVIVRRGHDVDAGPGQRVRERARRAKGAAPAGVVRERCL